MAKTDEDYLYELEKSLYSRHEFGALERPNKAGLLEIARRGKEHWNAWRRAHPDVAADFSGHRAQSFYGIDFSGFEFPTIAGECCVDFSGAEVGHKQKFEGARFGDRAKFDRTEFKGGASFIKAAFLGSASFLGTKFRKAMEWQDGQLLSHAANGDFRGCRFDGNFKFEPEEIDGKLFFGMLDDQAKHSVFSGEVEFGIAAFQNGAEFRGVRFRKKTSFQSNFFGSTIFSCAAFEGEVDFANATIWEITFVDCEFHDRCSFRGTNFNGAARFEKTVFAMEADFTGKSDGGEKPSFSSIRFLGCWFAEGAVFRDREFKSTALFGKATNKGRDLREVAKILGIKTKSEYAEKTVFLGIPDFHGCRFHQDTSFVGTEFKVPPGNDAARAFRTLKLAMEQLKSTHEEQKFFRLEMEADRPTLPGFQPWISRIYQITSDYGFSLWRPVAWLIGSSLMFGIAYGWLANTCAADIACAKIAWKADVGSAADRTSAVIKYTLASVSPVPGLDRMQTELRAPLFGHHGWIPITALMLEILHKIVALVMAFLFALALRNLFKMKS